MPRVIKSLSDLPASSGAYVLAFDITDPLDLTIGRLGPVQVLPGRYAYVGSARGPGGIRARSLRHARSGKVQRWHIDWISNAAGLAAVAAYVDGDECTLGTMLIAELGATVPIVGLGSSDCRRCDSHFVQLPASVSLRGLSDCLAVHASALWINQNSRVRL